MRFEPLYMLMIEFADGNIQLAKNGPQDSGQLIISTENDVHLLKKLGDDLIDEKIIIGYQLITTFEPPVRC